VRSWAEGLGLAAAWNRYLQEDEAPVDARRARSELSRLLDGLRAQARALDRPDIANLLRRDPEAIVVRGPAQPTLEQFRDGFEPDLYSESELLDLYQTQFGAPEARSPARRRQRLRARLVQALQWLERRDARAPQRSDPVAGWLDERVAERLSAAGVGTLDGLMQLVARRGFRWFRAVPRVGPVGAARVVSWLRSHEDSLGGLPAHALRPLRRLDQRTLAPAPRPGIVPLERLRLPAGLDGSVGRYRAPAPLCRLAAGDDLQAVTAWLRQFEARPHTRRAYRKEAERLLLWALVERGKALSSLDAEDGQAFAAFLAAPGPAWTAARNTPRWSDAWRPFEAGLSAASLARALSAVRSLCEWLRRQGYLGAHPWQAAGDECLGGAAVPPPARRPALPPADPASSRPALSPGQLSLVECWLDRQPPSARQRRWRCLFRLAVGTGLRLSELAAARVGWLQHRDGGWWIEVPDQAGPGRTLSLPPDWVESFRECLTDQGATGRFPSNSPSTAHEAVGAGGPWAPLVSRLDQAGALSTARLYEVLVDGLRRCADDVVRHDPAAAVSLRRASTRWLRHAYGRAAAAHGVPCSVLQDRLGHATPAAARAYGRSVQRLETFREDAQAALAGGAGRRAGELSGGPAGPRRTLPAPPRPRR